MKKLNITIEEKLTIDNKTHDIKEHSFLLQMGNLSMKVPSDLYGETLHTIMCHPSLHGELDLTCTTNDQSKTKKCNSNVVQLDDNSKKH